MPRMRPRAVNMGVDGLVISNHGGRQLDAAPHPLGQLPGIRAAVGGNLPIIIDSGVRSGLDVVRALASGADFVMLGRAFMYSVAALGRRGGDHAAGILLEEVRDVMAQLESTQSKVFVTFMWGNHNWCLAGWLG